MTRDHGLRSTPRGLLSVARNRYSVGAELWVNATDEDEARTLVGNFLDGFPEAVSGHDGDVMVQDVSLDQEGVEEDA